MLDPVVTETAVLGFVAVAGLVGLLGGAALLWSARGLREPGDVRDIVARAPYERLHNVLPIRERR